MERMHEPSIEDKTERDGIAMAFKYAPGWRLGLIDETLMWHR